MEKEVTKLIFRIINFKTNFQVTPEQLKDLGNESVKNQKFEEAILHYTYAIKLDPSNFTLHSNRSYAFLKVQQYYFALEDANDTIRLNPAWPKVVIRSSHNVFSNVMFQGYFRRGEVEYATGHYNEACLSYKKALQLKPDDVNIMEALNKNAKQILKEKKGKNTTYVDFGKVIIWQHFLNDIFLFYIQFNIILFIVFKQSFNDKLGTVLIIDCKCMFFFLVIFVHF